MPYRKKLIEVALPLEAINEESAREKSIRHGHPSTLHLWWARRPLAACRAVLFSSLVDDPSEYMPDEESANAERERLFRIIEDLVKWDNINNDEVLDKAKLEIAHSVARDLGVDVPVGKQAIREFLATKAPPVLDPFAGGGSIPLEAQRLGLRAYASDLNPVAVLINKALIEIPPKFADMPPVHPPELGQRQESLLQKEWKGAEGLAEDVRYYGKWMRDEAYKRIGYLYPPVKITAEILVERPDLKAEGLKSGDELTVIAWLWARTVKCPNPACGAQMPLARSFLLHDHRGDYVWADPHIDFSYHPPKIKFKIKHHSTNLAPLSSQVGRGAQFRCVACGQVASEEQTRNEFRSKNDGAQLMAVVAESKSGKRVYLHPYLSSYPENITPSWIPNQEMNTETSNLVSGRGYGITYWHELFNSRQLVALTTFSDLVEEVKNLIVQQIDKNNLLPEYKMVSNSFIDAAIYADAVVLYLAEAVSKLAAFHNKLAYWRARENKSATGFGRQALAMTWDYTEVNPFGGAGGDFLEISTKAAYKVISNLPYIPKGHAIQCDARLIEYGKLCGLVSTDPPYYDNVGYADLSDFFYIWLRSSLLRFYRDLFTTVLTPKSSELVAAAYRFKGDKGEAEKYFENGLNQVFQNLNTLACNSYPITVFYAFKQAEDEDDGRASTGWETMLEGLLSSSFSITGTWPMRTETTVALKANIGVLASSIVLVCRPRNKNAKIVNRRDFLTALKYELPLAFHQLQQGSIAPVDLAQAAIGPGMAVYSRYKQVLEADGSPMSIRTALGLINQALDEFLAEQEGEYDSDTRWALAWYEQYGHEQGPYGVAETLSKAKNTSVEGLTHAGFLESRAGKVQLLRRDELDKDWDPTKDKRLTAWEAAQYLIHALDKEGEQTAGVLLSKLGALGEAARDLAYRLYTVCEHKGWAQEALAYNMLVVAWPRIKEQASRQPRQENLL